MFQVILLIFRYPLTVSDIFHTQTNELINLFFDKFEQPKEDDNSSYFSVDEEDDEKVPEEIHSQN